MPLPCVPSKEVLIVVERHREAGAEACDSSDRPIGGPTVLGAKELFKENTVGVARHEVLSHIE
jgi:hypothetical protein